MTKSIREQIDKAKLEYSDEDYTYLVFEDGAYYGYQLAIDSLKAEQNGFFRPAHEWLERKLNE